MNVGANKDETERRIVLRKAAELYKLALNDLYWRKDLPKPWNTRNKVDDWSWTRGAFCEQKHTQKGDESFFINLKSPSVNQVAENPSRFVGKKCTVKYLETKQHFPEGGGEYDVQLLEEVIWDESPKSSLK